MDTISQFRHHVVHDWLPAYCRNPKKLYSHTGFESKSMDAVGEADARDCMLALRTGVVYDSGYGQYRAKHSSANEYLFWEGRRNSEVRSICLWLEPVITFAAVARLHHQHEWPADCLGMQPKGWAFDLAAFNADGSIQVLGEVKKTVGEFTRLKEDLLQLSAGTSSYRALENSVKKWKAVQSLRPSLVWLIGPAEQSAVYAATQVRGAMQLLSVPTSALTRGAA